MKPIIYPKAIHKKQTAQNPQQYKEKSVEGQEGGESSPGALGARLRRHSPTGEKKSLTKESVCVESREM